MLESVLKLVGRGIPIEQIYDMPLDVFRLYSAAAVRLEAAHRLEYISDTTAAVAALFSTDEALEAHRKSLEKVYEG